MVIPSEFLLVFRIGLTILFFVCLFVCLFFCMKLRIAYSRFVKNCVLNLMGIAFNLYIAFGRMGIFIMLILLSYENWKPFHLLISFSISFFG